MTASPAGPPSSQARWVAALLLSGVGLAGVGYSVATRPTLPPPPVVFVPQAVDARTGGSAPQREAAGDASEVGLAPGSAQRVEQPEPRPASPGSFQAKPSPAAGMTINVNTASAEELMLLPGIGPARAAAIIENRAAIGPFRNVEDLARVSGIGPATVEGVRPYVVFAASQGG